MTIGDQGGREQYEEVSLGGKSKVQAWLTTALVDQKVLADDGKAYSTVQEAENNAGSWIFIPPGTFNESVSVNTSNFMIQGSGEASLIDGGTTGTALDITAGDNTVRNLACQTTPGNSNTFHGIASSSEVTVAECVIPQADSSGVELRTNDTVAVRCRVDAENIGIVTDRSIVSSCFITTTDSGDGGNGEGIIDSGINNIISHNVFNSPFEIGILLNTTGGGNIALGNRLLSCGTNGIQLESDGNIVGNNRISDSGGNDLVDNGAGTVLDANLTGSAN